MLASLEWVAAPGSAVTACATPPENKGPRLDGVLAREAPHTRRLVQMLGGTVTAGRIRADQWGGDTPTPRFALSESGGGQRV